MSQAHIIGFPRIRENRELKIALEKYCKKQNSNYRYSLHRY